MKYSNTVKYTKRAKKWERLSHADPENAKNKRRKSVHQEVRLPPATVNR